MLNDAKNAPLELEVMRIPVEQDAPPISSLHNSGASFVDNYDSKQVLLEVSDESELIEELSYMNDRQVEEEDKILFAVDPILDDASFMDRIDALLDSELDQIEIESNDVDLDNIEVLSSPPIDADVDVGNRALTSAILDNALSNEENKGLGKIFDKTKPSIHVNLDLSKYTDPLPRPVFVPVGVSPALRNGEAQGVVSESSKIRRLSERPFSDLNDQIDFVIDGLPAGAFAFLESEKPAASIFWGLELAMGLSIGRSLVGPIWEPNEPMATTFVSLIDHENTLAGRISIIRDRFQLKDNEIECFNHWFTPIASLLPPLSMEKELYLKLRDICSMQKLVIIDPLEEILGESDRRGNAFQVLKWMMYDIGKSMGAAFVLSSNGNFAPELRETITKDAKILLNLSFDPTETKSLMHMTKSMYTQNISPIPYDRTGKTTLHYHRKPRKIISN